MANFGGNVKVDGTKGKVLFAQNSAKNGGGVEAWAVSVSGTASSFAVGAFSMSQGGSASGGSDNGICSRAMEYLSRSGLLYRGCEVW